MKYVTLSVLVILVGTLVTASGVFIAAIGAIRDRKKRRQQSDHITRFILTSESGSAWVVLLGTLVTAVGAILSSMEAAKKTEEIASLNKQIVAAVTGGESFPYLDIAEQPQQPGEMSLVVENRGDFPLYDVVVKVIDENKMLGFMHSHPTLGAIDGETGKQFTTVRNLGNMFPHQAIGFATFQMLDNIVSQDFDCSFLARNGPIYERIKLRRVGRKIAIATRSIRQDGKQIIETVSPEFPHRPDGSLGWDLDEIPYKY